MKIKKIKRKSSRFDEGADRVAKTLNKEELEQVLGGSSFHENCYNYTDNAFAAGCNGESMVLA